MSERNKGGRPALNEETRRTNRVQVTLSKGELDLLQNAAAGVPLPVWIRAAAIARAKSEKGEGK